MQIKPLISAIEALLFVHGEEMAIKDLQRILQEVSKETISIKEIQTAFRFMKNRYEEEESGLTLLLIADTCQLAARQSCNEFVQEITVKKRKKNLTQAAMEILTIVAYRQPVTKVEIEDIRGVKCDAGITSLLEQELICEAGRLEKVGRPILYATTRTFLLHFGLQSLEELPPLDGAVQLEFNNME